jgi:hypothetical protein
LDGLVDAAVATIRTWATTARDALMVWPTADPADLSPNRLAYEAALERNFRVSTIDWREELIAFALLPVSEAVLRLLDGAIRFVVRDRATFMVHSRTYEPVDQSPGLIINVSPPFRNAMDDNGRAGELYRALAHVSYPVASIRGWPGTVRYAGLDTGEQTRNSVAYASFAYETTTGFEATFRPEPLWYP